MAVTNWYVAAPMSTNVPAPVNTTQALEVAGFEQYDNRDYEVLNIGREFHPMMYTITAMGRYLRGDMKNIWANEKTTTNFPEFKWDERDESNTLFTADETINISATSLDVVSTAGLYPNLILRNVETNERIRITAVVDSTELTIQRAVWETVAQDITSWDKFQVIASASEAGKASESSFFVANQHKSNYIQKIVTTVSQDDFQRLGYKVGNYADTIMAEKLAQHMEEKEKVALFWEKKSSVNPVTWKVFYTAQWVITHCLNGWSDDISSALSIDTFEEALEKPLQYGSKTKILMGSYKAIRAIRWLYADNMVFNDEIVEVNMKFQKITINSWDFTLLAHPFLDAQSGYEDYLFVIDPKFIKFVYPQVWNEWGVMFGIDGKTTFKINPSSVTPTYQEWSYYTYMTLELSNANAFAALIVA